MIYQTVGFSDFYDAFQAIRPDNFSYEGRQALFNYLEELSDDIGEDIELDVIALCCDWTEAEASELREMYAIPEDEYVMDWLKDQTIVLPVGEWRVVFANF